MNAIESMSAEHIKMHIRTCFSTPSGQITLEWIRRQCWMHDSAGAAIKDVLFDVNARRDFFIHLEKQIKEGASYVASE
jgi:hypothetical protein